MQKLTAPQAAALRVVASGDFANGTPRRNVLRALAEKGLIVMTLGQTTNYRSKRTHYFLASIEVTEAGRAAYAEVTAS